MQVDLDLEAVLELAKAVYVVTKAVLELAKAEVTVYNVVMELLEMHQ